MYKILPYLYLGTANAVYEQDLLAKHKITDILNCVSDEVDNAFPDDYTYHNYEFKDTHQCYILDKMDEIFDIVNSVKDAGNKNIVIHCIDGKAVSPSIIIAYMLLSASKKNQFLPAKKAINYVKSKNISINPNDNFLIQISKLEKKLFGETSLGNIGGGNKKKKNNNNNRRR